MSRTKIIFFGTPDFAVPFLDHLVHDPNLEVALVVTQPDRPTGRKQIITPPPVKVLAQDKGIEVFQPETLKDASVLEKIRSVDPDLVVVVAYGLIIPQNILDIAPAINVHPSLLPKYRGASPVQSAILNQDVETGVSIMLLDAKMDHGPILAQKRLKLNGVETNSSLHVKLAEIGKILLVDAIKAYLKGEIQPQEQVHSQATYCQQIVKDQARLNWQSSADHLQAQIRAFYPWPVAWTTHQGKRVKIFPPTKVNSLSLKPGQVQLQNNQVLVGCGQASLELSQIQVEGKTPMEARTWLQSVGDLTLV